MVLLLTALRLHKIALGAQMDILQISSVLVSSMFQEHRVLARENQQLPDIGNANDRVTLLAKKGLIGDLNVLLTIIWLL
jgi:hypothetical protein